jgi:pimeloyl-ACP methyl ester carboxylesterase
MFRRSTFILALLLLYAVISTAVTAQQSNYRETPCPFDTSTLVVDVHCGLFTVPENRSDPNSRRIVLSVMTVESPNPNKAPEPVLYLTGGPGESAIAAMTPVLNSEQGQLLVQDRDWIIVDQRGTGYSVPRLDCNIFGIARIASPNALQDASQVCWERYAASGIDLSGYTTAENAADMADLREAMGYDTWNVFGVSYGTTLALTMLQQHPEGINAIVLDSILPPQRSFFISDVEMKLQALQRLFDACQQETACGSAYPNLAERFALAVSQLNEQPLEVEGLSITGDFLVFALTNTSVFQRDVIQQLPAILDQALNGNPEGLLQLLGGTASGTDAETGYESDLVAANDGMGLAMNCTRDALFPGVRETLIQIATQDGVANALASLYLRYLDACSVWSEDLLPITVPQATDSDVPVLLLVGEWDPSTPPMLAQEAAETLSQSTIIVFPGQGHSVLLDAESSCPASLVNAFLEMTESSLNTQCVAQDYAPIIFAVP